jgi:V/A-type H+/Na+-transporting ATPase subunit E
MAEELDSLLKKIQDEAVDKATQAAQKILEEARAEAEDIAKDAKKRAEMIVNEAEEQSERFAENGRIALEQAVRDTLLYLRKAINAQFDALFKKDVPELISVDVVREILIKLATEAHARDRKTHGLRVYVSEENYKKMADFFMKEFHDAVKKGAEIHPLPNLKAGFRICMSEDDVVYDYSDEVLVKMLSELVSPSIAERLDAALKTVERARPARKETDDKAADEKTEKTEKNNS